MEKQVSRFRETILIVLLRKFYDFIDPCKGFMTQFADENLIETYLIQRTVDSFVTTGNADKSKLSRWLNVSGEVRQT